MDGPNVYGRKCFLLSLDLCVYHALDRSLHPDKYRYKTSVNIRSASPGRTRTAVRSVSEPSNLFHFGPNGLFRIIKYTFTQGHCYCSLSPFLLHRAHTAIIFAFCLWFYVFAFYFAKRSEFFCFCFFSILCVVKSMECSGCSRFVPKATELPST